MTTVQLDSEELAPDNAARLAIYDVLCGIAPSGDQQHVGLRDDELFERVIGRLRILVPRELHLLGEREYVAEKVDACIAAGILARHSDILALTGRPPKIRYPDATVRDYHAGLEAARERLELDDAKVRNSGFNVHALLPSIADAQESEAFQCLVASMREHGYLKQFPIQRGANGDVIDGRARIAAATIVEVTAIEMRDRLPQRRDTPLQRVLLVLDANQGRITADDRERVHQAVGVATGRTWPEIESDLALTREWRRATPRSYTPVFDVKKIRFRPNDEPSVQVTRDPKDRKVMLRSLLEAAGLSNYKIQDLRGYVVEEEARTKFTANRKAVFVGMADAIAGITAMQRDRKRKNLKLDPQWNQIKQWLREQTAPRGESEPEATPFSAEEAGAPQHV